MWLTFDEVDDYNKICEALLDVQECDCCWGSKAV